MKRVWITLMVTAAAVAAFAWLARPGLAVTQNGAAGPVPRMPDGHPDLSGVWWRGSDIGGRPAGGAPTGARGAAPATPAPSFASLYQSSAQEKAKTLGDKDDPSLRC